MICATSTSDTFGHNKHLPGTDVSGMLLGDCLDNSCNALCGCCVLGVTFSGWRGGILPRIHAINDVVPPQQDEEVDGFGERRDINIRDASAYFARPLAAPYRSLRDSFCRWTGLSEDFSSTGSGLLGPGEEQRAGTPGRRLQSSPVFDAEFGRIMEEIMVEARNDRSLARSSCAGALTTPSRRRRTTSAALAAQSRTLSRTLDLRRTRQLHPEMRPMTMLSVDSTWEGGGEDEGESTSTLEDGATSSNLHTLQSGINTVILSPAKLLVAALEGSSSVACVDHVKWEAAGASASITGGRRRSPSGKPVVAANTNSTSSGSTSSLLFRPRAADEEPAARRTSGEERTVAQKTSMEQQTREIWENGLEKVKREVVSQLVKLELRENYETLMGRRRREDVISSDEVFRPVYSERDIAAYKAAKTQHTRSLERIWNDARMQNFFLDLWTAYCYDKKMKAGQVPVF
ncbi:unnamed protein product [Amoebophrya sp. A120]|nr:unnamed protein product [Amoebophrya sp. A120]|eukprot:GSA120T00009351001.1